jgi:hypothetical protein
MEKRDRAFVQKCRDQEDADTHVLIKDDGRFYECGSNTPFSGVRNIFFSKRFWEKEKKVKYIEYFEHGELIRYIGYYRNGNVAIDHITGQYPTRYHRDGTLDKRPEVNHR